MYIHGEEHSHAPSRLESQLLKLALITVGHFIVNKSNRDTAYTSTSTSRIYICSRAFSYHKFYAASTINVNKGLIRIW